MKTFFSTHNQTFAAEWQKLKRTGIIWLCIGVSLFLPLVITLVTFFFSQLNPNNQQTWNSFIQGSFSGFTTFFYPLFLVIMMLRLVYMEHRSDTWKLMETQPVSRLALFLAKYEVALIISLLSLAGLLVFTLLGGLFLQTAMQKPLFTNSAISWSLVLSALFRFWIASMGLLAVQYFISLLIKSFAWPMTIGLVAVIVGSSLAGFQVLRWFPFSATQYTSASYAGSASESFLMPHEKMSMLWAVFFLLIGYQYFIKKDFARTFLKPMKRIGFSIAIVLAAVLLFAWINSTVVIKKYGRTVVAGKISSDKPVDKIVVVSPATYDTVMQGQVTSGRFHLQGNRQLSPGLYFAKAGPYNLQFFFSSGDSVHLDMTVVNKRPELKIAGTRIAENEFLQKGSDDYWFTYNAQNYTPEAYAMEVMNAWTHGVKRLHSFKTVDNIRPADDFLKIRKKLLAVKLLTYIDTEYPKDFAVYHPNETLKYPSSINVLRKEVDVNDSTLLPYPEFTAYLSEYIKMKTATAPSRDSAAFTFIRDSIRSAAVRDALLYDQVNSRLNFVSDSSRRNKMLQQVLPLVQSSRYKQLLITQAEKLNSLQRGKKAPSFIADAITGNQVKLEQLANRYLVIDVWATWCGPCKREEPFFNELAERYTSPQVAFISISVDEDRNAWQREARFKSKRVMQLWANKALSDFDKAYAVNAIPRFMLIDAKGRILNAKMPPPSDPEFEAILQKEIPVLDRFSF